MGCGPVQDGEGLSDGVWGCFWATGNPLIALEVGYFFCYCKVDELVERHAFFLRYTFGYFAHGGHEPQRELFDDEFLLGFRVLHKVFLLVAIPR